MTDNVDLSDCEKTIMNVDEPIYGDLITEIDLHAVEDDKVKDSLTELVQHRTDLPEQTTELSTEPESFVNADILPQDDTVSEFFTVDSKPDEFENDMLIGELDNEGIDFKNETDVAECHHEYESKKLLFGDCEDIVEVVANSEVEEQPEIVDDIPETEPEPEISITIETVVDSVEPEKIDAENDENDPCFTVSVEEESESLNRMHVMEDVEEGCDVSGALPSSPGHAEQRPDPPKPTPEISSPVEQPIQSETALPISETPISVPTQNGISTEDEETNVKPIEENHKDGSVTSEKDEETELVKTDHENEQDKEIKDELIKSDDKAKELIELDETTNKSNEEVTKESSKRDEEDSSGSECSRGSQSSSTSKRKRSDDDCTSPTKKLKTQIQKQYANHDRILSEYIESSNCNTLEDIQNHTDQLLAEIRTLNELAREKEREWNNILHVKKVKEELLLRMQRKKQIMLMNSGDKNDIDWDLSIEQQEERLSKDGVTKIGGNLMMVPVVSSSPSITNRNASRDANSKSDRQLYNNNNSKTRNILPKNPILADLNGQECRQGRQGPILDVRSIIADYRQRHPETVPRRGRRMKSVLNAHNDGKSGNPGNVLSMASLALGSGSQMRHNSGDMASDLGLLLSTMDSMRQENSRPSSADSSLLNNDTAMSFKDVLVQFARLSQSERQEFQAQAAASLAVAASATNKPPPPPYPEVTLHPVPPVPVTQPPTVPTPQNQSNSLLHGILTKTQPRTENKPATFSPTLARLLTAPERVSNNSAQAMYTAALNSGVSISDLLSTGKSRNEITITPVGQYGQNLKHKDGEHLEEEEAEDSADRLVIDESSEMTSADRNRAATDNGSEGGDDVPQCQGCHQKSAQFVCAGCGNQWYCSRDCQVAAWDEHSEVCSG